MALIWFLLTYILLFRLFTPVSMGLGGKLWIPVMCRWNSSSTGHQGRRRALRTNLRSMWQCIHSLRLICSGVQKSMYISTSWPAFLYQQKALFHFTLFYVTVYGRHGLVHKVHSCNVMSNVVISLLKILVIYSVESLIVTMKFLNAEHDNANVELVIFYLMDSMQGQPN